MRAKDVPMHVDQAGAGGVEKQIDGLRLSHAAIAGEGQGVGAVDTDLVAAADQRFEFGDDARAPGPSLLNLGHLVFEKLFVNGCHRQLPTVTTYQLRWVVAATRRQGAILRGRGRRVVAEHRAVGGVLVKWTWASMPPGTAIRSATTRPPETPLSPFHHVCGGRDGGVADHEIVLGHVAPPGGTAEASGMPLFVLPRLRGRGRAAQEIFPI